MSIIIGILKIVWALLALVGAFLLVKCALLSTASKKLPDYTGSYFSWRSVIVLALLLAVPANLVLMFSGWSEWGLPALWRADDDGLAGPVRPF